MIVTSPLNEAGLRALAKAMRLEKAGSLLAVDKREAVAELAHKIRRQPILSSRDRRS